MVDIRKSPFLLSEKQADWVFRTLENMTLEEKIGQMFILLKAEPGVHEEKIENTLNHFHQGGLRWQGGDKEAVYLQNTTYQRKSKIPLLIAANCDDGGDGCLPKEGTFVATAAQAAAVEDDEIAYHMGYVAAKEASSIACNWLFNPVADIYMNWRNTIVNTRCFGDNAEKVIKNTKGFIRGVKDANPHMACCAKHFPGDGVDELDQHLVLGMNHLSVPVWKESFGRVYQSLIDDGIESIMAGHIALPEMSRHLRPGIRNEEIMPATLAPELLKDLLRREMGFNGLILTDATHMIGMAAVRSREEAMPLAIEAGCDMLLFANDMEEDMSFVKKGLESNILTIERVDEAVTRILALKAKLKLNEKEQLIPEADLIHKTVHTEEHQAYRKAAADKAITLVKDTLGIIPISPEEKKHVCLVYVQSAPTSAVYQPDAARDIFVEELEKAGFDVTISPSFYDLEAQYGPSPLNMVRMMDKGSRSSFKEKYDLVLVVANVRGYAQENVVKLKWSAHHSKEMPWYIPEVPTIGISLNFTNHLIDLPQIKTFINAFGSTRDHIRAVVEKMIGQSSFTGEVKEHYFCERWETRL